MPKSTVSTVEHLCAHVDRELDKAREAAESENFEEVKGFLEKARHYAGENKKLLEEVDGVEQEIERQRRLRVEELLKDAQALMNDPEHFDQGRIETMLDRVKRLDEGNVQAKELKEQLEEVAERYEAQRSYRSTRTECQALWDEVQDLVEAEVPVQTIVGETYDKALTKAKKAKEDHPNNPKLKGLVAEAERKYYQGRELFEILGGVMMERYQEVLKVLEERDPEMKVPLADAKGVSLGVMTVQEARREAEVMAEEYAHTKALEYLEEAKKYMDKHMPRAGRDELEKREELYLLGQEADTRFQNYFEDEVEPVLVKLEKAEEILARAEKVEDPVESWNLVKEAVSRYPYLPNVESVRKTLIPRLIFYIRQEFLDRGERALNRHDLSEAEESSESATYWSGTVERYTVAHDLEEYEEETKEVRKAAQRLSERYRKEEKLQQEFTQAAQQIEETLEEAPEKAFRIWVQLGEDYGEETLERFSELRFLKREIEAAGR